VTGLKPADGMTFFWRGYSLYWQGDHQEALRRFEAATKLTDDARFWYFRSLAERATGDNTAAEASLGRAARLHVAGFPRADVIGQALERVQGAERVRMGRALDAARTSKD
jgi:tetratricopeptide (TPR) repeat protein